VGEYQNSGSGIVESFTTSQLANAAGVNVETVRYYERRGLIPEPPRLNKSGDGYLSGPGYRRHTEGYVEVIRLIKRAQGLGFTLNEIRELLTLRIDADANSNEARAITSGKIDQVRDKIRELRRIEKALTDLIAACEAGTQVDGCPIITAMETPGRHYHRGGLLPTTTRDMVRTCFGQPILQVWRKDNDEEESRNPNTCRGMCFSCHRCRLRVSRLCG
jgi:MerR family mercuric resistance operon transcriptional regulator